MAYEPKTWECDEVISADALNHIEQGVAEVSECCEDSKVSVEIVKIAEAQGSGNSSSLPYVWSGGGNTGSPLTDLVGDKTIIGVVAEGICVIGNRDQKISVYPSFAWADTQDANVNGDIVIHQDAYKATGRGVGFAVWVTMPYPLKASTPIDVYAICI